MIFFPPLFGKYINIVLIIIKAFLAENIFHYIVKTSEFKVKEIFKNEKYYVHDFKWKGWVEKWECPALPILW